MRNLPLFLKRSTNSLFERCTCMTNLAVAAQTGGDLAKGEVAGRLFVPAEEQVAEAIAPAVRDRDDPSPASAGTWRRVAVGIVVAPVQAQVALARRRVLGRTQRVRDQRRIEQGGQRRHVVAVGPGEHRRQRHALAVGQQVALGATPPAGGYPAVGRVAPGGFGLAGPPCLPSRACTRHPSADCQARSSPISSSYTGSGRAQACCRQPCSTHSMRRSWAVDFGPNSWGSARPCATIAAR